MTSTSRGAALPQEDNREAEGEWGGKTGGVGNYADVNGIKLYYEIQARNIRYLYTAGSARCRCSARIFRSREGPSCHAVDCRSRRTADMIADPLQLMA